MTAEWRADNWKAPFFTIWSGQTLSLTGSRIAMFALIWWLTQETGSATVLAMATLFAMLPQIVLGPLVGVYVDRWNRRVTMIVADSLIALASLGLAYLFWSGHDPGLACLRDDAVPRDRRHVPLARHAVLYLADGARAAPGARFRLESSDAGRAQHHRAGARRAAALGRRAFIMRCCWTSITAILATTPLYFIAIPQPKRTLNGNAAGEKTSVRADLMEGLRYMLNWRGLMLLTAGIMVFKIALTPAFSLLPLLVTDHFGGEAGELATLEGAFGLGIDPGRAAAGRVGWLQAQHVYIAAGDLRDWRGLMCWSAACPRLCSPSRSCCSSYRVAASALTDGPLIGDPAENHRAGNAGARIYAVRQPHHADLTHWADHRRAGVGRGWCSGLVYRGRIGGHGVRDLGRSHPCDCQYRGLCLPTARNRRGTAQGSSRPPAPIGTRLALTNFEDRNRSLS